MGLKIKLHQIKNKKVFSNNQATNKLTDGQKRIHMSFWISSVVQLTVPGKETNNEITVPGIEDK